MQKVGGEGRKDAHAEHWDRAKQASNGMRNGETALDARKERACADELRAQRKRAEKEGAKEAGLSPRYPPHRAIRARSRRQLAESLPLGSTTRPIRNRSATLNPRHARSRWKRGRPAALSGHRRGTSMEGDGLDPGNRAEPVGPRRRRNASGF